MQIRSLEKNRFYHIMEFMIVTGKDKKMFPALFTYGSIQQLRQQNFPIFWPPLPQCVELKLRWRFCVHGSNSPEIYL